MSSSFEQTSFIAAILLLAFFTQALKEMGIPSPGLTQSLLLFAGFQLSHGRFVFGIGIILFILWGSICGAFLIFHLAKFGGLKFLAKPKRFVSVSQESVEKARKIITAHSSITVAVGRSIPGMMVPTSIVAGMYHMPIGNFLVGILFPLSLWIIGITTIGGTFAYIVPQAKLSPNHFLIPLGVLIASGILSIIFIFQKWIRRFQI
jgi:membrane protein DedA with SNARE-associated domain